MRQVTEFYRTSMSVGNYVYDTKQKKLYMIASYGYANRRDYRTQILLIDMQTKCIINHAIANNGDELTLTDVKDLFRHRNLENLQLLTTDEAKEYL